MECVVSVMEPEYLSTTEMAAILEVTPATLRRLVRDKKLTAYKPLGGHYRFDMDKTIQTFWRMESEDLK
jgi:excisionase family DNA binding protein